MISLIRSLFIPYSCRHCQICVCYLVPCDRGRYPATRLNADDAVIRLSSMKVGGRVDECGRAAYGVSRAKALIGRSAISSSSSSVAIICKWGCHITPGLSDNIYLQKSWYLLNKVVIQRGLLVSYSECGYYQIFTYFRSSSNWLSYLIHMIIVKTFIIYYNDLFVPGLARLIYTIKLNGTCAGSAEFIIMSCNCINQLHESRGCMDLSPHTWLNRRLFCCVWIGTSFLKCKGFREYVLIPSYLLA